MMAGLFPKVRDLIGAGVLGALCLAPALALAADGKAAADSKAKAAAKKPTEVAAVAGTSRGKACVSATEMTALNGRVLQSELLVAALSCDQNRPYAEFVEKYRAQHGQQAKMVDAVFKRLYGGRAARELDSFTVRLANDSALRTLEMQAGFCAFTAALFDEMAATPPSAFDTLTSKPWMAARHGFRPCS